MKLALFLVFYNNKEEIQRLLKSIPDKVVDYLFAIDGPFRYNLDIHPDLPLKSNDGSLEVLSNSAPKFIESVIIHYKGGATEFDKRNTYLEMCNKVHIDTGIVLDSDEYFIYPPGLDPLAAWQRFKKNIEVETIRHAQHNVYGIPYLQDGVDTYKPRIWTNPVKMRYINGSHYHYANLETEQKDIQLFKDNRLIYIQQALSIIKGGVIMTHDQSLRSEEYQKQRIQYQKYLVRYEELIQQPHKYKYTQEEADRIARAETMNIHMKRFPERY